MTYHKVHKIQTRNTILLVQKYPILSFVRTANQPKRYRLQPSLLRIEELIELGGTTSPRLLVDL